MQGWEPTKTGGFRRTRLTQKSGTLSEKPTERSRGWKLRNYFGRVPPLDTEEVGGSNPSPRTIIKFREKLGLPTCPYLVRWRIETRLGSVRLHHWLGPDDDRAFHDHPWDFLTFVLKGGYTDTSPDGDERLKAPTWQYRPSTHQHTVYPDKGGAWTLVFTGPKIRPWGFWVAGKFKKANKYFLEHGHHPCN